MRKWMRRVSIGLGVIVGLLAVLVIGLVVYAQINWDRPIARPVVQMSAAKDPKTIARGEYLYKNTLVCWGCHGSKGGHSPDEPQAGGREFDASKIGPGFGVYYATNLTPDRETGLGAWSDAEIVRAMREGVDREGHLIFPIMPYEWQNGLSDEDALAVVAYLRSLGPVRNQTPVNRPSFPPKALFALGMVKPLPAITAPKIAPPQGATVEYGQYLANHASGCAECHMPRNPADGQTDWTRPFAGGLFPFAEEGFSTTSSNLTPDAATGIGNWSEAQFMAAMRTGIRPNGTVILPFMPWPSYSQWSEQDLKAVWLYLRSVKPSTHEIPPSTLTGAAATGAGLARGEGLFGVYCVTCHGKKGSGSPLTNIPLQIMEISMDDAALVGAISRGLSGTSMPGFAKTISAEQIADIVAYIRGWSP